MKIIEAKNDKDFLYLTVKIPLKDINVDKTTKKDDKIKSIKNLLKGIKIW